MKNKRIVSYKDVNPHFKRAIVLKYYSEQNQSIITVNYRTKTTKVMKLLYQEQSYLIILDRSTLDLLEADYLKKMTSILKTDSLICSDVRKKLISNIFYS